VLVHALIATGVNADGKREILGLSVANVMHLCRQPARSHGCNPSQTGAPPWVWSAPGAAPRPRVRDLAVSAVILSSRCLAADIAAGQPRGFAA
jgi:hypothetical protein